MRLCPIDPLMRAVLRWRLCNALSVMMLSLIPMCALRSIVPHGGPISLCLVLPMMG